MTPPKRQSAVLTIRVPSALEQRLAREARRQKRTRSAVACDLLDAALRGSGPDLAAEARRQSLLVSGSASEREVLRFIDAAADRRGWK